MTLEVAVLQCSRHREDGLSGDLVNVTVEHGFLCVDIFIAAIVSGSSVYNGKIRLAVLMSNNM
jgi:hypothetical protein